jgi:hypothetical protein
VGSTKSREHRTEFRGIAGFRLGRHLAALPPPDVGCLRSSGRCHLATVVRMSKYQRLVTATFLVLVLLALLAHNRSAAISFTVMALLFQLPNLEGAGFRKRSNGEKQT